MDAIMAAFQKLGQEIINRTLEHIYLVFLSMVIAVVIALPLGIYLSKSNRFKLVSAIMGLAGIIQTVPSLALIAFIVVIFAIVSLPTIGTVPAVVALVLYGYPPG